MSIIKKLTVSMTVLAACVFIGGAGWANDIAVSGVKRLGRAPSSYWMVQFNVAWTNSWRNDITNQAVPFNYDAAWVFMKWRTNSASVTSDWQHASLSTNASDHVAPAGSTINVGLDGRTGAWGTNSVGVFIYRSTNGSGAFTANKVRLRWNHAADGVADGAQVELKVCAIEMVYVSSNAFYLGSTVSLTGRFYEGGAVTNAYLISSEDAVPTSNQVGCLWGASQSGESSMGGEGWISNSFPKGFGAFYGMKYEISQAQYVDFLNMLTRDQQTNRFVSTTVSNFSYSSSGQTTPANRNGVQLVSDPGTPYPRVYANNLNTNDAINAYDDGQWIACNFISPYDLMAYLDWVGLRPMTELEFEKACRGTNAAIVALNEYAWGTGVTAPTNSANAGTANETVLPVGACIAGNVLGGPMRVGCLGVGTGTRRNTGAGYYGMLELSGNLTEGCVTVGNSSGRSFTGDHGDGRLSSGGSANVINWPSSGSGTGFRGSDYVADIYSGLAFPNRTYAVRTFTTTRTYYLGGRGVRSVP